MLYKTAKLPLCKIQMSLITSCQCQSAKKQASDRPRTVDFAIGLLKFFGEFKLRKNRIFNAHQLFIRLVVYDSQAINCMLATAFPKMASCTTDFIYALTIGSIKSWP